MGSVFSNVLILLIYYLNVKIFNFQNMTLGTNIQDIFKYDTLHVHCVGLNSIKLK